MSSSDLLISFCIPTYNRSSYLKKCIQSLISYQETDIEIIIQDNASPDNTPEIVAQFSDKRIKYHRNTTNIGSIKNFITIIDKAKGKYVFFLTDDDFLLPGAIDQLKEFILKNNPSFVKQDLIIYLEKSKKASLQSFFKQDIIKADIEQFSKIYIAAHAGTGVCFKKEELDYDFIKKAGDGNYYPTALIAGCFYNNAAYLAYPVAIHIWENETFWGIDPNQSKLLIRHQAEVLHHLAAKISAEKHKEFIKFFLKHHSVNNDTSLLKYFSSSEKACVYFYILKKNFRAFLMRLKSFLR